MGQLRIYNRNPEVSYTISYHKYKNVSSESLQQELILTKHAGKLSLTQFDKSSV